MTRLAVRRMAAWAIDWLIIIGYAAVLVPAGLLLNDQSLQLSPGAWSLISFALLIVPVTVWLAFWEARPRAASPGKRRLRLRVQAVTGRPPRLGRALVRNGLKVALPWELGHIAAFTLVTSSADGAAMTAALICGIAACVIGFGYLAALFVGSGRTPYDIVAGTSVHKDDPIGGQRRPLS